MNQIAIIFAGDGKENFTTASVLQFQMKMRIGVFTRRINRRDKLLDIFVNTIRYCILFRRYCFAFSRFVAFFNIDESDNIFPMIYV